MTLKYALDLKPATSVIPYFKSYRLDTQTHIADLSLYPDH